MLETMRKLIEKAWVRIFYNPYTIGNYFRRKGARIGKKTRILIRDFGSEPYLIVWGTVALFQQRFRLSHTMAELACFVKRAMP